MASIIESEEELACLNREVDEELDQVESTIVWLLSQNYLKSTINSIVAVDDTNNFLGDVALLKTMNMDTSISKSNSFVAMASSLWKMNNSENIINMREQIANNGKEQEKLFVQMQSGELEGEVEQYREKIREMRSKKHSMQTELNEKQQNANAEELSISGVIDMLKEIKRDLDTTIQCYEQELQKVENIMNDVAYDCPLFADVCE
ncbi:uncharacterized protein LOC125761886 isoform X1 [Anopheles funestus]|uniref:uncharacterized protein LOC125761886 isoform X1 n=1 Tax=Anopheles funestus TaxID=62324 RepID=UPI0020C63664|nr:uncharacterized protein LOC125761886 isoform X1 [Anopheles funestus]XP_049279400.1 uncharacterized protein LOC125761886 isoform X1 [Anopheles funestus]